MLTASIALGCRKVCCRGATTNCTTEKQHFPCHELEKFHSPLYATWIEQCSLQKLSIISFITSTLCKNEDILSKSALKFYPNSVEYHENVNDIYLSPRSVRRISSVTSLKYGLFWYSYTKVNESMKAVHCVLQQCTNAYYCPADRYKE